MKITGFSTRRNELELTLLKGRLSLTSLPHGVVRVRYTLRNSFSGAESLMMLPRAGAESEGPSWRVADSEGEIRAHAGPVGLRIAKDGGAFTWFGPDDLYLVREPDGGGKFLEETAVERTVFDESTELRVEEGVDGARARAIGARVEFDRNAYSTQTAFVFAADERIFGLGQHEEGILDYRGKSQFLYQQNMKIAVPMIVSTAGYGVLWDTYSLASFRDDENGSYFWTEVDDQLEYYFLYGPELDDIAASFRRLTGRETLFPKWAYGYLQSKERYVNQAELVAVAAEYRRRGFPLDCIVQDWRSWEEPYWGQKSFDPLRFPDPDTLTDQLHRMNVRMLISIWPHMRNDGPDQVEMRKQGLLLGNDSTYNAFEPEGRSIYWKQAEAGLFSHGIDGWWCDCTEPFEADWRGSVKPEPWQRVTANTGEAKRYLDPEFINAYSLLHSRGIYEGQRASRFGKGKRVVNLTRSYYPGQQRYGTVAWSGDVCATWETLRRQVVEGLNFSVTGAGRWTLDIGGFFVGRKEQWFWSGDFPRGCEDPGYRELYVRWFQLGAMLPMFRSHGTDTPREAWRFGEPGDPEYDALVETAFLRYSLLPYIYSLAGMETHNHRVMMRMLAFDFRHDYRACGITDQFMFGPALMVCPVTFPMYFGPGGVPVQDVPKCRRVYLPAGVDWYDFRTGRRYRGGSTISADAPLRHLPVFVPAGAVLPLGPRIRHTGEGTGDPWEIRIYPGADGEFDIYEDAGDGFGYEVGELAWVHLRWIDSERKLAIGTREGEFPGCVESRTFNVVVVGLDRGIGTGPYEEQDGRADAVIEYSGQAIEVAF